MKTTLKISGLACLLALALIHSSFIKPANKAANQQLVKSYYDSYVKKDWNLLKSILSPGFHFSSPVDDHIDLNSYHTRCWPNSANTKKFDIEKVIMGDDDAFVTYNGYTNDGKIFRNTEYFKFKGGKITENFCYFGPGVSFPNNKKK